MKTALTLAALITLTACTSAPAPEPTGPLTTVTTSRDIFLRGVRGAATIPPSVVTRTYSMACGPAPDGASDATRATRATAIITQANGRISTAGVGTRISESGDAQRANPTLVTTLNCRIQQMQTTQKLSDQAAVLRYALENGLLTELADR